MLIQIQGSHNLDSILICKLTGTGSFPDSFSTVIRPLGKQPQTSHSTIVYVGNLQAFEDCLRGFRKVGFTNEKLQKHELFWRWITWGSHGLLVQQSVTFGGCLQQHRNNQEHPQHGTLG